MSLRKGIGFCQQSELKANCLKLFALSLLYIQICLFKADCLKKKRGTKVMCEDMIKKKKSKLSIHSNSKCWMI